MNTCPPRPVPTVLSAFAGFFFPPDVIVLAVRWYLRFGLSYRDVEELLAERRVAVDHVTIYRWVQRFTPLLAPSRPALPAWRRGSLAGGRDVCEGRWEVAVRLSRDRPIRAGHRRVRHSPARREGSSAALRTGLQHHQGD